MSMVSHDKITQPNSYYSATVFTKATSAVPMASLLNEYNLKKKLHRNYNVHTLCLPLLLAVFSFAINAAHLWQKVNNCLEII